MAKKAKSVSTAEAEATPEQSYYLQRAYIKDFRSIRDTIVEFKPGLNIIIGPNGSGKTNLLRVIKNGIDFYNGGVVGTESLFNINSASKVNNIIINYKKKISTTIPTINSQHIIKRPEQVIEVSFGNEKISAPKLQDDLPHVAGFYKSIYEVLLINHGVPKHYLIANESTDFTFDNFGTSLAELRDTFPKSIIATIAYNISFNHEVIQNGLRNAELIKIEINKSVDFHLNLLKKYLISYSPIQDIRIYNPIRISYNSVNMEVLVKGIVLEYLISNDWLPFDSLSSGTQRLFYIISEIIAMDDIYFDESGSERRLAGDDKIILLEEPELGIHPDQLEKLLTFLREQSKKHQIIITTHSPQVLDMLNDDELDRITICELHKTKGTQFRKLKKTQIATAQKYMHEQGLYLSDYWRYGSLESTK